MPNDMPGKGSATTAPKPHKVSNAGAPLKTLSSPSIILVLALLCLLDSLPNYNLHTTMFVHTHTFFEEDEGSEASKQGGDFMEVKSGAQPRPHPPRRFRLPAAAKARILVMVPVWRKVDTCLRV